MNQKNKKRILVGSLMGNVMEFYDFALYGYLLIHIKSNFFPEHSQCSQHLLFWGSFLSGYLSRPFGAVFFGKMADKFGRRHALLRSVLIMTSSTFLIGLLPNYDSIGLLSTIMIFLLRIAQGFAVSGEEGTVAVYLSEMLNKKMGDGKISAWILISILGGVLLGSLVCFSVQEICTKNQMNNFGWRIPYLFSIFLGISSIYYRIKSQETCGLKNIGENRENTFLSFFKKNIRFFIALFLIPSIFAIPISINLVVIPNFLAVSNSVAINPLLLCSLGIVFTCVFSYFVGSLSNLIGHKKMMFVGCIALIVLGYPISELIQSINILYILMSQIFISLAISMTSAPLFVMMIGEFPAHHRCVGFSLTLNTGMAIFAGTTPWVVESITSHFNFPGFFGFYLIFSGLIGIFSLINLSRSLIFRSLSYEHI